MVYMRIPPGILLIAEFARPSVVVRQRRKDLQIPETLEDAGPRFIKPVKAPIQNNNSPFGPPTCISSQASFLQLSLR